MKLRWPKLTGNLARDEALLKGAQVDLARYQGLAAQNAVPHQTLDTQVALVAQDQGTVEVDQRAVKSAEVNLQYCRIISPLDGRVGLRLVDQGNYVTSAMPTASSSSPSCSRSASCSPCPRIICRRFRNGCSPEQCCPPPPTIAAART